ncbi:MAG: EamA family transporter RarD [Oxalobacteraceae bacterium]|jgi:chloramphenicol-sensitive protein RarD|nr:EamA family transporter RarD [Oxalobacteraceae sp. CFBP 8761]MBD8565701.1 EamA family transporter RarD [Oxalobacteraceae sp. CFBP 8763]MBD8629046.1 EamA family transporter RarD [Oxalobacteraceae sp. CFBP 8753]MBD8725169.1 EamA family transporter RarD [Oxalobacteraceae sp. CFBP 13708]RYE77848.1 MAG: EamA family transporter RarD [Oxalobacteraceae bacterium]
MRSGIIYAALAFFCWGLFPIYFHALGEVPPLQILAHRMLWSLAFLLILLLLRRDWKWLQVVRQPRVFFSFVLSALLLSANWLVYIWSVMNHHVIEASLGYFINPLVNIVLGYLILKERMRPLQWAAIGVAALGVAWLTWQAGTVPWIALFLALSFGGYGLLRKTAALGPLEGLSFETIVLFPLAAGYVIWLTVHGQNVFINTASDTTRWLLIMAGPLTAIPLLLFATGARKIPLSILGLLQYLSPTLQFLLGVWLFKEAFSADRLVGFVLIWSALALFAGEGLLRRQPAAAKA